jgi:tartrate-resistant acid phosphatase type 5
MSNIALLSFGIIYGCTFGTEPTRFGASEEVAPPEVQSKGTTRFVVLGDAGVGDQNQYEVAIAMENICGDKGCDFALYLGDNFYETGVSGIDDIQFIEKFENPYSELDFPFYAVLGNHDYGSGTNWDRPDPQIAYTDVSDKWIMPDRYHSHRVEHALFVGIDSNAIIWDEIWEGADAQSEWVTSTLNGSDALWKIAYGHHPYLSNGSHGIAGQYDNLPADVIASGKEFKTFVDDNLCGKIDIYFSGHDHDLQWLEPSCGVEFIVSGAGGKSRSSGNWGAATRFEAFDINGFAWVEINDSLLTVNFYDKQGTLLYEGTLQK